MRKLILTAVIALGFATATQGQTTAQCTGSQNNPVLGVDYTYEVKIGDGQAEYDGTGTDAVYKWYITQDNNLLDNTKIIEEQTAAGVENDWFKVVTGGSTYNSITGTKNQLTLNWKEKSLESPSPFFLVLNYSEGNGTGCTPNNIKVLEIKPLNTFQLEITPVKDETGADFVAGEDAAFCAGNVSGATIVKDAGVNKVKYLYGEQTLYYKVTAKGFKGKWLPQIKLPALVGAGTTGRRYKEVQWKQGTAGTFKDFDGTLNNDGSTQNLTAKPTEFAEITDATAGTPIIVKVVVENQQYEGLTVDAVELAADGTIKDTTKSDINGTETTSGAGDACNEAAAFAKKNSAKIKARPKVQATSGAFIVPVN